MQEYFIGVMSGTSGDGIDAALVDFSAPQPQLIAHYYQAYAHDFRERLLNAAQSPDTRQDEASRLDIELADLIADCCKCLLRLSGISANRVRAIGSHGHTLRHEPNFRPAYSLQIGDPNRIALNTRIATVADFRRADIAAGGQGAPLVPAFHAACLGSPDETRVVVNIGGIANITLLPVDAAQSVVGFDTGPGNTLLDVWYQHHCQGNYDMNGAWASTGASQPMLLQQLLSTPYFSMQPPKSTGREYFNLMWLQQQLSTFASAFAPEDIQATLVDLTAKSIVSALPRTPAVNRLLVCGGGVHNAHLMKRLQDFADKIPVTNTAAYGLDPDWVEAMAFAWLARQRLAGRPGNLTTVTGARREVVLGGIYQP